MNQDVGMDRCMGVYVDDHAMMTDISVDMCVDMCVDMLGDVEAQT